MDLSPFPTSQNPKVKFPEPQDNVAQPEENPWVDVDAMQPDYVLTPEQRRLLKEQNPEPPEPDFFDLVGMSVERDWVTSSLVRLFGSERHIPDPSFSLVKLSEEEDSALFGGLSSGEAMDLYDEAVSFEHAFQLRQNYNHAVELEHQLAQAGWTGITARTLTSILDPVALAASTATLGVAAPAVYGLKVNRLGRMLYGAGLGATGAATSEAALVALGDPVRDGTDIALAGLAGAVFGGVGYALGKAHPYEELIDRAEKHPDLFQPDAVPRGSAGAMHNPVVYSRSTATDKELQATWKEQRPVAEDVTGQFDMIGQLSRSTHDGVAHVASLLMPNSSHQNKTGIARSGLAWEEQVNTYNTHMVRMTRINSIAFKEWAKDRGLTWSQRVFSTKHHEEFLTEVSRAVRGAEVRRPAVKKLATEIQGIHASLLQLAKEYGVEGFENVAENMHYLRRRWNYRAIKTLKETIGTMHFERFLANAIVSGTRKAGEEMDDDLAHLIAESMQRSIESGHFGATARLPEGMMKDTAETLLQRYETRTGRSSHLDAEELEDFLENIASSETVKNPRAKRRVVLDELYEEGGVRLDSLLDNNAFQLTQDYIRKMAGHLGMARVGFKSEAAFDAFIERARRTAPDYKIDGEEFQEQIGKLTVLKKMIMGQPLYDVTQNRAARRMGRILRDLNFIRLMGQAGASQVVDGWNIASEMGMRSIWANLPAVKGIFKRCQETGRLDDDLADELESVLGVGTDRINRDPYGRFDDFGTPEHFGDQAFDRYMNRATHVVADLSFMNPVNTFLERFAARAAVHRLAKMALTGKRTLSRERLLGLGLDEGKTNHILEEMRRNADWVEGSLTGRRIASLNLAEWSDEAADDLRFALQRWVRTAIQKNDPGDLAKWMTSEWGKVICQFRSFALVAWSKQFLRGVRFRDGITLTSFLGSSMLGALTYMARTASESVGRPDAEEYLEKRLSLSSLAKAAATRANWSSFLPDAVDTALLFAPGVDPLFSHTRSTGLGLDILNGNPTLDLLRNIQSVGGKFGNGKDMTFNEYRQMVRLLPFQNLTGVTNALSYLGGEITED